MALILLEKLFRFFVSLCAAQADETVILFADVSHSMKRTEWLNLKSFLYVLNFVFISTHFSDSATKKFSCILMRRAVGVAESCTRSHVRFTIELYTARCATINPTTNNDELMVNDSYIYFCFLLRSCFCFVLCVWVVIIADAFKKDSCKILYPKTMMGRNNPLYSSWTVFFFFFLSAFSFASSAALLTGIVVLCAKVSRLLRLFLLPLLLLSLSRCRHNCTLDA